MAYQDGTFPYGAPVITTGAGLSYKCNSFTYDVGAETVQIIDQNGAPSGALVFDGFTTGSAELQIPNNSAAFPSTVANNATQGLWVNVFGTNQNAYVTGVSISKPQRGPWIATCQFQKAVN